jgi:hypothetical protein
MCQNMQPQAVCDAFWQGTSKLAELLIEEIDKRL